MHHTIAIESVHLYFKWFICVHVQAAVTEEIAISESEDDVGQSTSNPSQVKFVVA